MALPSLYHSIISLLLLQAATVFGKEYGKEDCSCVGIDLSGAIRPFAPIKPVESIDKSYIGFNSEASFPPELGTSCQAWDEANHPSCTGAADQPAFCAEKWCYVDPCKCKSALSASVYLPNWKYHKRPLHFSYQTCGSSGDSWFDKFQIKQHTSATCDAPETGIGSPTCPCVGLAGRPGHIMLSYGGAEGPYKAEIGSTCGLWENGAYPSCTTPGPDGTFPEWCHKSWCYVDMCNCKGIAEAPRPTQKIAGSNFQGAPMYFSFNTCGNKYLLNDGWVEKSCWTKTAQSDCEAHSNLIGQKCGWYEDGCVDANLIPICSAKKAKKTLDEL